MIIKKAKSEIKGVPDYYNIYIRWFKHYEKTGEHRSKVMAYHYARVAEEMGQATIDEDITVDDY